MVLIKIINVIICIVIFTIYQSFILKYDKDRSIFKFVIVKAAQDDGK